MKRNSAYLVIQPFEMTVVVCDNEELAYITCKELNKHRCEEDYYYIEEMPLYSNIEEVREDTLYKMCVQ